ncbi:MAG: hypothetical protein ACK4M7_00970 [Burkholderiales bacterium]
MLCKHNHTVIKNRKLGFWGTNYTNHADQFRQFIEKLEATVNRNYLKQLPPEILHIILSYLDKAKDIFYYASTNKYNRAFVISEFSPVVRLSVEIFSSADKFESFLNYLKLPDCIIKRLSIYIPFSDKERFNRILEALISNKSITELDLCCTLEVLERNTTLWNFMDLKVLNKKVYILNDKFAHITYLDPYFSF